MFVFHPPIYIFYCPMLVFFVQCGVSIVHVVFNLTQSQSYISKEYFFEIFFPFLRLLCVCGCGYAWSWQSWTKIIIAFSTQYSLDILIPPELMMSLLYTHIHLYSYLIFVIKSCVMCHVSHVMCHKSRVKCHVSGVTCNFFSSSFLDKVVKLIGGGSVINRAYPV